jgi:L-asparaginase II
METLRPDECVELAVVERSGFVESRHLGALVVVGPEGDILLSQGNPAALVYGRSALKPFQATAIISSGVNLTGEYAAIVAASHTGTDNHVRLVRQLLHGAGLTADALGCPADWPGDLKAQDELVLRGETKSPLYMNCSGKHAGMLLACVANEWPTAGYLDPAHPLQKKVVEVIERFTGERISHSGTDGCGAPVHAISLVGLAKGIRTIAQASPDSPFGLYRSAATVATAMRRHGWVIEGPGGADTVIIDRLGLLSKQGAEGVMVLSTDNGTTVALKILDGNLRVAAIVALHALGRAGAVSLNDINLISKDLHLDVFGGGRAVGEIRPVI